MLVESRRQRLYAEYHQFLLRNDRPLAYSPSPLFPGDAEPELWTHHSYADRLAVIPGQLSVSTGSNDFVEVVIEVHTLEPALDLEKWDHVAEGPLDMQTPGLVVAGCLGDNAERSEITPGPYRVRCSYANIAGKTDGPGDGQDWYLVQLWSASLTPVHVLKRLPRPGPEFVEVPPPNVSITPSAGGETRITTTPQEFSAQSITLRHLVAILYRPGTEPEFPRNRILGPSALDQALYDISATGPRSLDALRRLVCLQFNWRFKYGVWTGDPGPYLLIEDGDAEQGRHEYLLRQPGAAS